MSLLTWGLLVALLATTSVASEASDSTGRVRAVVLGTAQDGGVPQANCRCERCSTARSDSSKRRLVASLALQDVAGGETFIVDATPDLPAQLDLLARDPVLPLPSGRTPLAGILLTHAHAGHYTGLVHLGREVLGSRELPLHVSDRMGRFLETNAPWSQLVELRQACLVRFRAGEPIELTPRIRVTALRVPHRDELSDTHAFVIEGPSRRLLWLPDIDKWEKWDLRLEDVLADVDYAFLDATFHSASELPGRDIREIPHPLVTETAARLAPGAATRRTRVFLVHLNHSNALLSSPALRAEMEAQGLELAEDGMALEL